MRSIQKIQDLFCRFRLVGRNDRGKKAAFTLAETLITLGIVGVVAVMTIPNLLHFYKIKRLETDFKKADALIQQALKVTGDEYGIPDFNKFTVNEVCGSTPIQECRTGILTDISNTFLSNFKIAYSCTGPSKACSHIYNYNGSGNKYHYKDYAGFDTGYQARQLWGADAYLTPNHSYNVLLNGMAVTAMTFKYHSSSDHITFTFDTNGPDSGPNRMGYDIFIFSNIGTWYPLCTAKTSAASGYNGRGCYRFAKQNKNPDDKTKEYWKSLK